MRLNPKQMESTAFLTVEIVKYLRDIHKQIKKHDRDFAVSSHKFMLAMVGGIATVLNDFQADLELACTVTGDDPKKVLMFRNTEVIENYVQLFAKYLVDGKRKEAPTNKPTGTA